MGCIGKAQFNVLFLGVARGDFVSSRGLRQGDPLSPFLFILSAEILSRGLANEYIYGNIAYYYTPRACLPVSHLLYVDDTLIFLNARLSSVIGCKAFL